MSGDDYPFDFSAIEREIPEDVVVRTEGEDGRYVDMLVTPSGHRALWGSSGFASAEEALEWLRTING